MSRFSEMEWNNNSKWDWENLVSFDSKPTQKSQQADWMVVDDGENNPGLYNLSDGGHDSSGKSSISASTDSSTRDFRFGGFKGVSGISSKKVECDVNSPPSLLAGSVEPLIGLKLGKRTYFENNTTFKVMPTPTCTTLKKNMSVCCQVEGCNVDLFGAKDYHRKHRVCDIHSKFPKVIVGGQERRFCQQCSRFHSLCEFDEKKRSCRRRLSDHNARRRKQQPETIQYSSTRRLSSPFYGGTQQMSFMSNNSPANHVWDGVSTLAKGYPLKSYGDTSNDGGQLYTSRTKFPHVVNVQNGANGVLAMKYSTSEVFNPGSKRSVISPRSLDAAPDRALSLLSSNAWDSRGPEPIPSHNNSNTTQSMIQATPEGTPLSSAEFWLSGQQSMHPNNFQEFQIFKAPYEPDFYSSILN